MGTCIPESLWYRWRWWLLSGREETCEAGRSNAGTNPKPSGQQRGCFGDEERTRPHTFRDISSYSVGLDQGGGDLPITTTYILVQDSDNAVSSGRLEETGDREQDGIHYGIGEHDIEVAESLFLGLKSL